MNIKAVPYNQSNENEKTSVISSYVEFVLVGDGSTKFSEGAVRFVFRRSSLRRKLPLRFVFVEAPTKCVYRL